MNNLTIEEIIINLLKEDKTKKYDFTLKEHKEKRSLDANAYYWVLINKIANILHTSKEEIHINMLKRYSQVNIICVPSDTPINKLVKYYELDGVRKNNNKIFKIYKVYTPSSEMNKQEMGILIDGIVSECKEMGIETLTPNQLLDLKNMWGE